MKNAKKEFQIDDPVLTPIKIIKGWTSKNNDTVSMSIMLSSNFLQ